MNNSSNSNFPTLDKSIVQRLQAIKKDGEPSLFAKVVNLYNAEVQRLLKEIHIGFDNRDTHLLSESIHSLKSCSGNIGATKLAFLCQNFLEEIRQDKSQFELFHNLFNEIMEELNIVADQITLCLKDTHNAS